MDDCRHYCVVYSPTANRARWICTECKTEFAPLVDTVALGLMSSDGTPIDRQYCLPQQTGSNVNP